MSSPAAGTARAPARGDDGFTLVELLVVMGVLAIVLALAGGTVITTMQSQRRQMTRLEALEDLKVTLHRVTRDLRAADPLQSPLTATSATVAVERGGLQRTVTFRLDGDTLLMDETNPNESFTHTLTTDLDTTVTLFTYEDADGLVLSSPVDPEDVAVVQVRLVRDLPEQGVVELTDRITVRNAGG